VASIEANVQGKNEPLRDYIERFNKEVVQVRGADETMKQYLITKGLHEGTDVKKDFHLDLARTLNEFLMIATIYIKYEEELYADGLNKSRKEEPAAESSRNPFQDKKKEDKVPPEGKAPNGHPWPCPGKRSSLRSQWPIWRKLVSNHQKPRHRRGTESTRQSTVLKDAIELLIQRGPFKQFMKNPESERNTIELITDGTTTDKIVAMSVEQLGDFLDNVEVVPYSCIWEQVPSTNVIT